VEIEELHSDVVQTPHRCGGTAIGVRPGDF